MILCHFKSWMMQKSVSQGEGDSTEVSVCVACKCGSPKHSYGII